MDWWLKDKGFQNMVALKWGNYHPHGWGGYALKQKLKFIKGCIRQWRRLGLLGENSLGADLMVVS